MYKENKERSEWLYLKYILNKMESAGSYLKDVLDEIEKVEKENGGRSLELYLKDILDEIENIQMFIKDFHNFEEFSKDKKTYYAVIKSFENIGEAVKKIPKKVRKLYPIEWKRFAGFRDVLAHKYYKIDLIILWLGIHNRLPELKYAVKYLLKAIKILKELNREQEMLKELKSDHYEPPLNP